MLTAISSRTAGLLTTLLRRLCNTSNRTAEAVLGRFGEARAGRVAASCRVPLRRLTPEIVPSLDLAAEPQPGAHVTAAQHLVEHSVLLLLPPRHSLGTLTSSLAFVCRSQGSLTSLHDTFLVAF